MISFAYLLQKILEVIHLLSHIVVNSNFELLLLAFAYPLPCFKKHVNIVFKDLILQGHVFLYLDNFITPAKTDDEALQHLKLVFATVSEYGLEII